MDYEDNNSADFKDISELKKELENVKNLKDASGKDVAASVQKLAQSMSDMLQIITTSVEQMKVEEKEFEEDARKHEAIISKLDKIIDQNKTIAEGMVAVVNMVKEKTAALSKQRHEPLFKPREEQGVKTIPQPSTFMPPQPEWQPPKQDWQPKQEWSPKPMMPPPTMPPNPLSDLGFELPPIEPSSPDFGFPEEPLEEPLGLEKEEPKKKGLFGLFNK